MKMRSFILSANKDKVLASQKSLDIFVEYRGFIEKIATYQEDIKHSFSKLSDLVLDEDDENLAKKLKE